MDQIWAQKISQSKRLENIKPLKIMKFPKNMQELQIKKTLPFHKTNAERKIDQKTEIKIIIINFVNEIEKVLVIPFNKRAQLYGSWILNLC